MAIDPTKSGNIPLGGVRPDQAGSSPSTRQSGQVRTVAPEGGQRPSASQDQVSLSEEARAAGQAEGGSSPSGLSRERLQEVLKRLTSGYYDNPEVQAQVAARIQRDLTGA